MVNWGLVGTGLICQEFAQAFKASVCQDAKVVALCSRKARDSTEVSAALEKLQDSSQVTLHSTPEAISADERVEVVYLGVPTSTHSDIARRCLTVAHRGLRAVVVEKPMTMTAAESQALMDLAQSRGILLVEAVWSRFFPLYRRLADVLRSGELGTPLSVTASFGWRGPEHDTKLHDVSMGNGSMRVVGCYAVNLAVLVFNAAPAVVGEVIGRLGAGGAETFASAVLDFGPDADGRARVARVAAAVDEELPCDAEVVFTAGTIKIAGPFLAPLSMKVLPESGDESEWTDVLPTVPDGMFSLPHSEGLAHEIAAISATVAQIDCLGELARRECSEQPWEHTLATVGIIEQIIARVRAQAQ